MPFSHSLALSSSSKKSHIFLQSFSPTKLCACYNCEIYSLSIHHTETFLTIVYIIGFVLSIFHLTWNNSFFFLNPCMAQNNLIMSFSHNLALSSSKRSRIFSHSFSPTKLCACYNCEICSLSIHCTQTSLCNNYKGIVTLNLVRVTCLLMFL